MEFQVTVDGLKPVALSFKTQPSLSVMSVPPTALGTDVIW